MSTEDNKKLVRRQFELVNAGDSHGAAALWAPESWNHGRKVDHAALEMVYRSLSSLHETHTLHEMIAEGEWVAVRTTCNGVHSQAPEDTRERRDFHGSKSDRTELHRPASPFVPGCRWASYRTLGQSR